MANFFYVENAYDYNCDDMIISDEGVRGIVIERNSRESLMVEWCKELDLSQEYKATDREKEIAQETYGMMQDAGFDGTYAGGSRSKGNGFWLTQGKYTLGYLSCMKIKSQLKKTGKIDTGYKAIRDGFSYA